MKDPDSKNMFGQFGKIRWPNRRSNRWVLVDWKLDQRFNPAWAKVILTTFCQRWTNVNHGAKSVSNSVEPTLSQRWTNCYFSNILTNMGSISIPVLALLSHPLWFKNGLTKVTNVGPRKCAFWGVSVIFPFQLHLPSLSVCPAMWQEIMSGCHTDSFLTRLCP